MSLANRKIGVRTRKNLSQAIKDARYSSKYFENKENLLKNISYKRDLANFSY
ncbi:MAG: hypothetical protein ACTSV5_12845 [Promethearchaeota archaeon]